LIFALGGFGCLSSHFCKKNESEIFRKQHAKRFGIYLTVNNAFISSPQPLHGKDAVMHHAIWLREFVAKGQWTQEYEKKNMKNLTVALLSLLT